MNFIKEKIKRVATLQGGCSNRIEIAGFNLNEYFELYSN
jgi:hypothetical protein